MVEGCALSVCYPWLLLCFEQITLQHLLTAQPLASCFDHRILVLHDGANSSERSSPNQHEQAHGCIYYALLFKSRAVWKTSSLRRTGLQRDILLIVLKKTLTINVSEKIGGHYAYNPTTRQYERTQTKSEIVLKDEANHFFPRLGFTNLNNQLDQRKLEAYRSWLKPNHDVYSVRDGKVVKNIRLQ